MPAGEETLNPAAARERALVDRVIRQLAGSEPVVDAAALAGESPQAATLVTALREQAHGAVVACVGVLERLIDFVDVVEALVALSIEREATVVIAVPNDVFAAQAGDQAASAWGEGAVAELRRLLPDDHVLFREIALRGAALVADGGSADLQISVPVDARDAPPVGFVLAFGPRASRLAAAADVAAADLTAEREYDRVRTAELEVLRATARTTDARPALGRPNGAHVAQTPA